MENAAFMDGFQRDLAKIAKMQRLSEAVQSVDNIISLLSAARDQVAQATESHTASLAMTKLQNPVAKAFENVNDRLKGVSTAHKKLGKALDQALPLQALPADNDVMADHPFLVNRAIAIHLIREGQFNVASEFIAETKENPTCRTQSHPPDPSDVDEIMAEDSAGETADVDEDGDESMGSQRDLSSLQSQELQEKFAEMYSILRQIKTRNLSPAIEWARTNSAELEARASTLDFELSKLQYIWLFQGPAVNGLPDDQHNGVFGAVQYARESFGRFQGRHLREIQELISAAAFSTNIPQSPYRHIFSQIEFVKPSGTNAFDDVAASFTREFCSLLGLSAESPLHVAMTAGALALPVLMKYTELSRAKGTEWTTANELPFATPLPDRMIYHSIFVCPVSREQTTEKNPPMVIPCGHVLAHDSLNRLCKGNRVKCPYCPSEGSIKDARQIIL